MNDLILPTIAGASVVAVPAGLVAHNRLRFLLARARARRVDKAMRPPLRSARSQQLPRPVDHATPKWQRLLTGDTISATRPPIATASDQSKALYPALAAPGLGYQGPWFGKELYSGGSFHFDPFTLYGTHLTASNMLVMGGVGYGKSSAVKSYVRRQLRFRNRQAAVIDSKNQQTETGEYAGEYARLCQEFGVTPIRLRPGGELRLNPLDPGIAADRQAALLGTIGELALNRVLGERERAAMLIARERIHRDLPDAVQPTLLDLVDEMLDPDEGGATELQTTVDSLREDGRDLAYAYRRLTSYGDLAGMFDGPTNVTFDPRQKLVVFDLSAIESGSVAMPILMAIVGMWLEHTWIRPDRVKRILVFEEGWHVIANEYVARLAKRWWKLCRALGLQCIAVVHQPADVPATTAAASLLEDTQTYVFYPLKRKQCAEVQERWGLPTWAADTLQTIRRRGVAVWMVGGPQTTLTVQHLHLNDYEEWVCETDSAMEELDDEIDDLDPEGEAA